MNPNVSAVFQMECTYCGKLIQVHPNYYMRTTSVNTVVFAGELECPPGWVLLPTVACDEHPQ